MPSSSGAFPEATRRIIYDRADRCCERCGIYAYGGAIQHRLARGMGGSKNPAKSAVSNGVLMCAPCHAWVEDRRNRAQAEADGWFIPQDGPDPALVPIRHVHLGFVYLDPAGMYLYNPPLRSIT